MNASPMSMTPSGTPGHLSSPGSPHSPPSGRELGDIPETDEMGSSYFRRTSLAIAAARRFTLYEAAATSPTSPVSPRAVHFPQEVNREREREHGSPSAPIAVSAAPAPVRSKAGPFGVSFGTSFFSRGGSAPARYPSPLQEGTEGLIRDEEATVGGLSSSPGKARAHQMNVAAHPSISSKSPLSPTTPSVSNPLSPPLPSHPPLSHGTTDSHYRAIPRSPPSRPLSISSKRRTSSSVPARYRWLSGGANTGDEPGVDVRSQRDQEAYGHLKGKTHVTVVDYCGDPEVEDTNVRVDFPGERVGEWLKSKAGQRPMKDGKPCGVRWIHVSGLNWEVVKALTITYGLHPLAVEDALRSSRSPRSKCDFYANHLYLQILVYHIHAPDRAALARVAEGIPEGVGCDTLGENETDSPVPVGNKTPWNWWWKRDEGAIRLPEGIEGVFEPSNGQEEKYYSHHSAKEHNRLVIEKLTASYMVPIRRGILSIFMLRDGTLISLSAHEIHEALAPIYERLEDESSLLRRSNDVSMLCHALIDVSVDLSVEIAQAFEAEILKIEAKVLIHAHLELVRYLHIIQAQILRFRRQISSLLHACYVLRDQDSVRAQAADSLAARPRHSLASEGGFTQPHAPQTHVPPVPSNLHEMTGVQTSPHGSAPLAPTPLHVNTGVGVTGGSGLSKERYGFSNPANPHHNGLLPNHMNPRRPSAAPTPVPPSASVPPTSASPPAVGWFSPLAKVYMNDVIDHVEMVVSSAEQFVGTCDHLTDYCFNVLSFQTNNSMERLSIVTVVFLPLTFIASYFGMNFEEFPSLDNPDSYFWRIAGPCTIMFLIIFSYSYITSAWATFTRRMARHRQKSLVSAAKKRD